MLFDSVAKDVELAMYAATVRGIILYHAHHLKVLTTYGALADTTKVLPRGGQLAQAISVITEDDHRHKRPLSTAIVVNSTTKVPGSGFFEQCRQLGYQVGLKEEEQLDFWYEQLFKLGVQPVVLDRVGKSGSVSEIGGIHDIRQAARNPDLPKTSNRPVWTETVQRQREAEAETAPGPRSQLPTG